MAVIDSDAHVIETERTWDFVDEGEEQYRPRTVVPRDAPSGGGPRGREFWLVDGHLESRRSNIGVQDTTEATREMEDIEGRLRHMDDLGIDVQVLYPSLFLRPVTNRPEVELALCKTYNRWMADIWKQGAGRLRWAVMLPWFTVDKAVEQLRFAKENGACAIFARYAEADQLLVSPSFYPIYEEADSLNIPLCIHASSGTMATHQLFSGGAGGVPTFKLGPIGAFHSIAISRLPDMFPNLRFGFVEVQAQWVPYICHDLYRRSKFTATWWKDGLLRERRLYVACQTDDDLPYVLQYAGEDNLVIGTDYGHNDTSSEIEALRVIRERGDVEPRIIDKILDDNARALYGL
jgi:predicted TIM-barrel fold metal-dependent hydrolase